MLKSRISMLSRKMFLPPGAMSDVWQPMRLRAGCGFQPNKSRFNSDGLIYAMCPLNRS
jgi:hypothetical protein